MLPVSQACEEPRTLRGSSKDGATLHPETRSFERSSS
ncbi:MAG: hypothetical protein QOD09_1968 [Bradyrhizobium sp.]|jgi:hypothetical protein|nr:hypothetical protein [Bradyrhizobium sp.]